MSVPNPEPEPTSLMSVQKYTWWCRPMVVGDLINPKIAVLLNLMGSTPRPTRPDESLFAGYLRLAKFHDGEPDLLLTALLKLDPAFFADLPTRAGQALGRAGMKAAIGEAACSFLRWGTPGFRKRGTPGRAQGEGLAYTAALAAAVEQAKAETESEPEPEPEPEPPG
jgi:hypothetical protein